MKEYRILREIENPRLGPNNHKLLENQINELAKDGWSVSSLSVTHAMSGAGAMLSQNTWFCALMEREAKGERRR